MSSRASSVVIAAIMRELDQLGRFDFSRDADDSRFEAYVFTRVIAGLEAGGYRISYRGTQPGRFVIRGSPGRIYSPALYSYAHASKNGNELEVHVDLQVRGNTGVLHELDVALIDANHGDLCRSRNSNPSARKTRGAVECKFYQAPPQVAQARTFTGLLADMGHLRLRGFCTNQVKDDIRRYFDRRGRAVPFFDLTPLSPTRVAEFQRAVAQAFA